MTVRIRSAVGVRQQGFGEELLFEDTAPELIEVDASGVRAVHPTLAARLHLFEEWHRARGRDVSLVVPDDSETERALRRFRVGQDLPIGVEGVPDAPVGDILLPLVRLTELSQVDTLAEGLYPLLIEHFDDVAVVRDAVQMAVSELCQNGIEHGTSSFGCLVAVRREIASGHARLVLGVVDLGVGIPDHIRRRRPDLLSDEHAIATAMEPGVSGAGKRHGGQGFEWILRETLASASTEAQMAVRAGRARYVRRITGGVVRPEGGLAAPFVGTAISHTWTTVVGR